jgi:hypothetical protein
VKKELMKTLGEVTLGNKMENIKDKRIRGWSKTGLQSLTGILREHRK